MYVGNHIEGERKWLEMGVSDFGSAEKSLMQDITREIFPTLVSDSTPFLLHPNIMQIGAGEVPVAASAANGIIAEGSTKPTVVLEDMRYANPFIKQAAMRRMGEALAKDDKKLAFLLGASALLFATRQTQQSYFGLSGAQKQAAAIEIVSSTENTIMQKLNNKMNLCFDPAPLKHFRSENYFTDPYTLILSNIVNYPDASLITESLAKPKIECIIYLNSSSAFPLEVKGEQVKIRPEFENPNAYKSSLAPLEFIYQRGFRPLINLISLDVPDYHSGKPYMGGIFLKVQNQAQEEFLRANNQVVFMHNREPLHAAILDGENTLDEKEGYDIVGNGLL